MKRYIRSTQDIYGMARVGFLGNLEIYVNTNDGGNIPHFHIRLQDDWDKFHSCIKITCAEYFPHEGKEDTLNAKQRKDLWRFMTGPVTLTKYKDKFSSNWELVCFLWDLNNSAVAIPEGIKCPDYRQLQ